MQDTNRHLEAGVCNNHTGRADFEENCSLERPYHSTKEKQSLIRIIKSPALYRNTYFFPMYFHLAPAWHRSDGVFLCL